MVWALAARNKIVSLGRSVMRMRHLEYLGALTVVVTASATACSYDADGQGESAQTTGGPSTPGPSATAPTPAGPGTDGEATVTPTSPGGTPTPVMPGPGDPTQTPGPNNTPSEPLNCTDVTACGGDVVGVWNVTSSCLKLEGDLDVFLTSLACATVPATGQLETTGSIEFRADGTYSDNTTTTGFVSFPLDAACLAISGIDVECSRTSSIFMGLGWTEAVCSGDAGACNCELSVEQDGGMGMPLSYTEPTGTYSTMDTMLKAMNAEYQYCSAGDTLTVTPTMQALTGTIELQKEGSEVNPTPDNGMGGDTGMEPVGGEGGMMSGGEGGAGGMEGPVEVGGAGGEGGDPPVGDVIGPCDIYEAAGTPCVAAHSTVRALFGAFDGDLYQVKRQDGMLEDIPVLSPGGFADAAAQEAFCSGSSCVMWKIYDQTGNGNFLEATSMESEVATTMNASMSPANAAAEKVTVGGHEVYSLFTRPSQSYWNDGSQNGMPVGTEPQGVYMVTSGTHFNEGCCYNYGNGQLDRSYSGGPMMDSVYFGSNQIWGTGAGNEGPWVMADMEDGMLAGGTPGAQNNDNIPLPFPFVTAIEKNNGTDTFALKGADATSAELITMWDGPLPNTKRPMQKQGAVIMGAGGDCCYSNNNLSEGTFYEGAIVSGYPTDETDEAIHQNVVEVGYGK